MYMEKKTCCVTGHREIAADKVEYVKRELRREIAEAIGDNYTHFLSGFADGADVYFSEAVLELKAEYPNITLGAAIPYRKRLDKLHEDVRTRALLAGCSEINIYSGEYFSGCFMKRNRAMVQASERVIAVHDGRDGGGTVFTMREASILQRDLRIIRI